MVSEEEIANAYKLLASTEGVLAEPASSASVAGLIKSIKKGKITNGAKVVCVLTGNGLKDPDSAMKYAASDIKKTTAKIEDIVKTLKL